MRSSSRPSSHSSVRASGYLLGTDGLRAESVLADELVAAMSCPTFGRRLSSDLFSVDPVSLPRDAVTMRSTRYM